MDKNKKPKQKKWKRFRHRVVYSILRFVLAPIIKFKYRATIEKYHKKDRRQFLILLNHQTPFDQFFIAFMFKKPLAYFVASEDIFSNGLVSKIIKSLVSPIPIKKQTTDLRATMNCIKVAKEGSSIAIAPEGNRTYSGKTEYIKPSIVKLIKFIKLPLALVKIDGGYGVQPRWADKVRKGKMKVYVSRVVEYDEYKDMPNDELYELIKESLYVNENRLDLTYKSNRRAEFLERALYVCPHCGLTEFISDKNAVKCKTCGMEVEYGEDKTLTAKNGECPFTFMGEWYDYQNKFVIDADFTKYIDTPMFTDKSDVYNVVLYKHKQRISKNAKIKLFYDKIVLERDGEEPFIMAFDDVSTVTVLGRNKLNVYHKDQIYQFKGNRRFNALKYVNVYHKYVAEKEGTNVEFLGL